MRCDELAKRTWGLQQSWKYKGWEGISLAAFGALSSRYAGLQSPTRVHSLGGIVMNVWKKAVVLGAIGSATILFMKKRYPAGVLATGVGLAVLAAEDPGKVERVRRALPEYFERGMRGMDMAGAARQRISQSPGRGAGGGWGGIWWENKTLYHPGPPAP